MTQQLPSLEFRAGQGKGKGCIGQHRRLGLLLPTFPAQRKDSPFVTYDSLQSHTAADAFKQRCPRIYRPASRVGNTAIERERFAVELWEEAINLTVILFKSSDLYVRFL